MKSLVLHFDGGNAGGIATWAVLAKCDSKVVAKLTGLVDPSLEQTNNVAEWSALYMAMVYAFTERDNYNKFIFKGDSQLVVKQMLGEYAVSKEHLKVFHGKALSILNKMRADNEIEFLWIPREQNSEVDELGRILRQP